jgi:hypothetical protein
MKWELQAAPLGRVPAEHLIGRRNVSGKGLSGGTHGAGFRINVCTRRSYAQHPADGTSGMLDKCPVDPIAIGLLNPELSPDFDRDKLRNRQ